MPVQGGLFYQARSIIPTLALNRRLPMLAYSRETSGGGTLCEWSEAPVACPKLRVKQ
jgi:hypothetical protein